VEVAVARLKELFPGYPDGIIAVRDRPDLRVVSIGEWKYFERSVRHIYDKLAV